MIPLPDPEAPPNSPSHPNAYPVFSTSATVMALYPDTSCFYRAEVIEVVAAPREGRVSAPPRLQSKNTVLLTPWPCRSVQQSRHIDWDLKTTTTKYTPSQRTGLSNGLAHIKLCMRYLSGSSFTFTFCIAYLPIFYISVVLLVVCIRLFGPDCFAWFSHSRLIYGGYEHGEKVGISLCFANLGYDRRWIVVSGTLASTQVVTTRTELSRNLMTDCCLDSGSFELLCDEVYKRVYKELRSSSPPSSQQLTTSNFGFSTPQS